MSEQVIHARCFDVVDTGNPPYAVFRIRVYEGKRFKSISWYVMYTPIDRQRFFDALRTRYNVARVYLQESFFDPFDDL